MLVVGRKKGESIIIGDDIEVTVVKVEDGAVKLAISAPKDVTILRKELVKEVQEENKKAASIDFTILKKLK
ncbi:carbon storage regulator CsrA [Clostridium tetani]|uniref:carbon storage regulator CsrA n=1 Tax=Clostridium tetani TaxID=1513 RepID=UPI0005147FDE|nr:carbon storage regulator CsrA [Clostridium tetani]KGI39709.1 carbon storage regulator [Clostridium tetani ATCC 9441]RXM74414.1 carbon storage regulator [Clostridium tetani]SUY66809.1 carbon storage regulator [Clostridium tetani]